MGEEEVGELSGNQTPQDFTVFVGRIGCSPEGKEEHETMRDLVGFILESLLCLGSGGWSRGGDMGAEYCDSIHSAHFTHLFLGSSVSPSTWRLQLGIGNRKVRC